VIPAAVLASFLPGMAAEPGAGDSTTTTFEPCTLSSALSIRAYAPVAAPAPTTSATSGTTKDLVEGRVGAWAAYCIEQTSWRPRRGSESVLNGTSDRMCVF